MAVFAPMSASVRIATSVRVLCEGCAPHTKHLVQLGPEIGAHDSFLAPLVGRAAVGLCVVDVAELAAGLGTGGFLGPQRGRLLARSHVGVE